MSKEQEMALHPLNKVPVHTPYILSQENYNPINALLLKANPIQFTTLLLQKQNHIKVEQRGEILEN